MEKLLPFFVVSFCMFSLVQSCKKDDTKINFTLPEKTQIGQNTLGFLLNSSVWTNYGQVCLPFAGGCRDNLSGIYYENDGDILINADRVIKQDGRLVSSSSIEITLNTNFRGIGNYSTSTNDTISFVYIYNTASNFDSMYILPQTNPTFNIKITKLDTINKILSGEFSGKVFKRIDYTNYTTSLTDSIRVDDGRFDIKLK